MLFGLENCISDRDSCSQSCRRFDVIRTIWKQTSLSTSFLDDTYDSSMIPWCSVFNRSPVRCSTVWEIHHRENRRGSTPCFC